MIVTSEKSGVFNFFDGNQIKGRVVYSGKFSSKAQIIDNEGRFYRIVSLNIWKTWFELQSEGKALITLKKKWNGTRLSKSLSGTENVEYFFKHAGLFNSRYVLQDKDAREMVVIKGRFKWKGLKYHYEINVHDSLKRREQYFLWIALTFYLTRDMMRQHAAGAATI